MSLQLEPGICLWPFELPARFLRSLGYLHVVDHPRRYVGLYFEPCDELAHDDGETTSCGCLHQQEWLAYFWKPQVDAHVRSMRLEFGCRLSPATHWLIIDSETNVAYVCAVDVAWRVVRLQRLHDLAGRIEEARA
jgi:hypothetical protein